MDKAFETLYSKDGNKKRKVFHDGWLALHGSSAVLHTAEGAVLHKRKFSPVELRDLCKDSEPAMGPYVLQVGDAVNTSRIPTKASSSARKATKESATSDNETSADQTTDAKPSISSTAFTKMSAFLPSQAAQRELEVDAALQRRMRPHQLDAAQFIFAALERTDRESAGCILAHEMGLGKTLTALSVVHAYIRRNPACKCVIVTPSSLVDNWRSEVKRWLPLMADPLVLSSSAQTASTAETFAKGNRNLLILSYEMFRKASEKLSSSCLQVELIVCDEAHRLKNLDSQTSLALRKCGTRKRLLLTGTPIQNNLDELYSVVSFALPNLLGSREHFRERFSSVIENTDAANANRRDETASALRRMLEPVMLQGLQSEVLSELLPPKRVHLLLCSMSESQESAYTLAAQDSLRQDPGGALTLLTRLRSLATVHDDALPSGKLQVLETLLAGCAGRGDKVVVVSNFTGHLDRVASLLQSRGWAALRIDGAVPTAQRQPLVDRFNAAWDSSLVMLLSARAGGAGINLIGANRLVMLDPDWNPSVDAQAMARVWRQGQRKPVAIYRLFSAATVEETIFRRQQSKLSLAEQVTSDEADYDAPSAADRDAFRAMVLPPPQDRAPVVCSDDEVIAACIAEDQQRRPERRLLVSVVSGVLQRLLWVG